MSDNIDTSTDAANWTDNRDRQETLEVGAHCEHTKHREPQLDEGASDTFTDDRNSDESGDAGTQSELTPDKIDGQRDLTGGQATTDEPEWIDETDTDEDGAFVTTPGAAAARAISDGVDNSDESEPERREPRPSAELDLPDEWTRVEDPKTLTPAEVAYERNDHEKETLYVCFQEYTGAMCDMPDGWYVYVESEAFSERYHLADDPLTKVEAVAVAEAWAESNVPCFEPAMIEKQRQYWINAKTGKSDEYTPQDRETIHAKFEYTDEDPEDLR